MEIKRPECDCEVVDDPEMVCPLHQEILYRYVDALEKEVMRLTKDKKRGE